MHEDVDGDSTPFNIVRQLIEETFSSGEIPQALHVETLILIPKLGSTEYRGIGLLETIWKTISSIINSRIKHVVQFDEAVHGFRQQRGMGTAILTNKFCMLRSAAEKKTVQQIYLDLKKAYNTIDCTATLRILGGYGIGPNIQRLLGTFWGQHTVVPRAIGYHGRAFRATRGVTQGDIISLMIFNLVLDCIIKAWKLEHPEKAEIIQAILYVDDRLLHTEDAKALQETLDEFTEYFLRVGLHMNAAKTKQWL
jgi:Reverse transcriptase (RNA-dependent DNA polymerase)